MTIEQDERPTYRAEGGYVWKNPVARPGPNNSRIVTIGFRVCKMCDEVGDEAAETIAALMNAGERLLTEQATLPAPEGYVPATARDLASVETQIAREICRGEGDAKVCPRLDHDGYACRECAAEAKRIREAVQGSAHLFIRTAVSAERAEAATFQERVRPWLLACFGETIAADREERNHRFLEEALELVQACGCTASEAHQLVDYVFGRPAGQKGQEVGGVMVTMAALCLAQSLDMHGEAETELARIWTKVEQIRAKQAAKPKHSPLPEVVHGLR